MLRTVMVCSGRPAPHDLRSGWSRGDGWSCVVPLAQYQLGMRTRRDVLRQLRVDLPRSRVRKDGRRLLDPQEVMRCTPHARLCTQAVMAPPVEWLIAADLIAYELPSHPPLEVDVLADGAVRVRKLLGVRSPEGALREPVEICVDVDGSDVVVTLQSTPHGSS